ncbi:MAG: hypothetical protein KDI79_23860 [Anaerolineae bacterium]|nr:hypothetical protein [Anaerolineae bacterium]
MALIGLMILALRQQIATQKSATPRLVGEAMVQSVRVSTGFLGFGHAAGLYAPI